MWRPYFTSAAWDPYAAGSWAYYSGAGYSYVSPYPWGWTPYHYGSWNYCPGAGWGWQPGGTWTGLNNGTTMTAFNPSGGNGPGKNPRPIAPPHPPRPGEPTLIAVGSRPAVRSEMASNNSFVFRKDSAGLGVPRGELGELNKFSQHAIQKGTASTPVYVSVGGNNPSAVGMRPSSPALGPVSIHRGSPPPPPERSSIYSSGGGSYGGGSNSSSPMTSPSSGSVGRPSSPSPSPSPAPSRPR